MPRSSLATALLTTLAGLSLSSGAFALTLTSSAFTDHGALPQRFTCTGAGLSPPLAWGDAPAGTRGYALIVTDPDAPDPDHPPTHTYIHWVIAYLPAAADHLDEAQSGTLAVNSREGVNSTGHTGYTPPCPPAGRHRYIFTLYALDTAAVLTRQAPNREQLLHAIEGHVLAHTRLTGTFRHRR